MNNGRVYLVFGLFVLIILAGNVEGINEFGEVCMFDFEYDEDFSADPGWITDQPNNYFWESDSQTFHATTENTQGGDPPTRYSYTPIEYNGDSMKLEFDIQPVDMQWSSGVHYGLYDSNLAVVPYNEALNLHFLWVHIGRADSGRHLTFGVRGENENTQIENMWNVFSDGMWYHVVVEYFKNIDTVKLTMTESSTGNSAGVIVIDNVGGLSEDLDYLGFARDPHGSNCPGASGFSCSNKATVNIDNIEFYEGNCFNLDCNGNDIYDIEEIENDSSLDKNENEILDECEEQSLEERIVELEIKVNELEERIDYHESKVVELFQMIEDIVWSVQDIGQMISEIVEAIQYIVQVNNLDY